MQGALNASRNAEYLSKKLGARQEVILKLIEDPRDEALIISQIAADFHPSDSARITPDFHRKILIFNSATAQKFDFDEICYMLTAVFNPQTDLNLEFIHDPTEFAAKKNILLTCSFNLPMSKRSKVFTEEGFKKSGHKNLFKHISEWIRIIKDIPEPV